jgi:uncharacterized protein YggE
VVGSGKATAKPDMAEVQMGVVTQAPSAAKALRDNNDAMTHLFKTLEGRGIAKKDVQTVNFTVAPQYRPGPNGGRQPEIAGYQVSNEVRVKVRPLDTLGPVLDEVVQQGANQVQSIRFGTAEPHPLLDEARRKALDDAHHKAELYARAAGAGLGHVLRIEEQVAHLPRPEVFGAVRAAAAVPVAPGEQEFDASITVTYRLEVRPVSGKSRR